MTCWTFSSHSFLQDGSVGDGVMFVLERARRHHHLRGDIAPRRLKLQLHLPGGVELNPDSEHATCAIARQTPMGEQLAF
jgi:hypothetical protein